MAQIREIKNRMVAVGTIQRITKTMQMIATAKFTAAVQRAKSIRPFTDTIQHLVEDLAAAADEIEHPLIDGPPEPVKKELLLVVSSDRGLCGAYNANVLRLMIHHSRELEKEGVGFDVEVSGKKAIGVFKFHKVPLLERYVIGDKPDYADIERIAEKYISAFVAGKYDAVRVGYMRFVSNARQFAEVMQLLPLKPHGEEPKATVTSRGPHANYELSPSAPQLLADLLPLAVKSRLYQAFSDAVVSEQIMRMVAMKAATENARDLKKILHRNFNRARQTQITTELTEIIGGSAALE